MEVFNLSKHAKVPCTKVVNCVWLRGTELEASKSKKFAVIFGTVVWE